MMIFYLVSFFIIILFGIPQCETQKTHRHTGLTSPLARLADRIFDGFGQVMHCTWRPSNSLKTPVELAVSCFFGFQTGSSGPWRALNRCFTALLLNAAVHFCA